MCDGPIAIRVCTYGGEGRCSGGDGEAAVAWAEEITRPGMREAAMVRAAKQYFKQDSSATQEWFVSSGLPIEAWYQISGTNPKID